ncbi:Glutathione S-transferase T2 [Linum perenne]
MDSNYFMSSSSSKQGSTGSSAGLFTVSRSPSNTKSIQSQSIPVPPAETRPDNMVEPDGMSNDVSRKRWSVEDDKLIASSYHIISIDSVKGNTQNTKDFWARIARYYNKHVTSGNQRKQCTLNAHWFNISPLVNKFNQCIIQTKRENYSGWSDYQVMEAARKLIYSMRNKYLKYEHVWMMVKYEPKWNAGNTSEPASLKKKRMSTSGVDSLLGDEDTTINTNDEEVENRLMGQKKAKRRARTKVIKIDERVSDKWNEYRAINVERMDTIKQMKEVMKGIQETINNNSIGADYAILSKDTNDMTEEQLEIGRIFI